MIPWKLLDQAQTPGNGEELRLYQHDADYSIKAGNYELMNSRIYGSEDALAKLACQEIADNPRARVLIGGLGMGYTVRTALNQLGARAQVVVAELVPAVVKWNRGVLAHLAGRPLDDRRVTVQEDDVAQMIKAAHGSCGGSCDGSCDGSCGGSCGGSCDGSCGGSYGKSYDAILLDVDNGPQGLVRKDNDWLYGRDGLNAAFGALRPKGVLAVWSSGPDAAFARRLRQAGFQVNEAKVRARGGRGKGGAHHIIWTARRV